MKKGIYNILKGQFLISDDAIKNWRFILFCTALAIVMIACSHSTDRKVHHMARLQKDVRQLRSQFVDQRKHMMQLKMESTLKERLQDRQISTSNTPPQKIIIAH